MRHFDRIIGFVAVSFVLVFLGKVNKTDLYTAYFKTIADVEIRNSTALEHGDASLAIVHSSEEQVDEVPRPDCGTALLLASMELGSASLPMVPLNAIASGPGVASRYLHVIGPRAPCA